MLMMIMMVTLESANAWYWWWRVSEGNGDSDVNDIAQYTHQFLNAHDPHVLKGPLQIWNFYAYAEHMCQNS
jgi:hypothetical protein